MIFDTPNIQNRLQQTSSTSQFEDVSSQNRISQQKCIQSNQKHQVSPYQNSNSGFESYQQLYQQRINQWDANIQKVCSSIQQDELLETLNQDQVSSSFQHLRVKEILEQLITDDREKLLITLMQNSVKQQDQLKNYEENYKQNCQQQGDQIQKLQNQVQKLEEELKKKNILIDEKNRDIQQNKQKFDQKENELKKIQNQNLIENEEAIRKTKEIDYILQKKIEEIKRLETDLEQETENAQKFETEYEQLNKEYNAALKKTDQLLQCKQELETIVVELQRKVKEINEENDRLKNSNSRLSATTQNLQQLEAKCNGLQSETCKKLQMENMELSNQLKATKEMFKEKKKKYKQQMQEQDNIITKLQQTSQELQNKTENLLTQTNQQQQKYIKLECENTQIKETHDQKCLELKNVQKQLKMLESGSIKLSQHQDEVRQLKSRLEEHQNLVQETKQISSQQIDDLTIKLTSINQQYEILQEEYRKINTQNQELQTGYIDQSKQIDEQNQSIKQLESEIRVLMKLNQSLKDEKLGLSDAGRILQCEIIKEKQIKNNFIEQLHCLEDDLKESIQSNRRLNLEIESQNKQIAALEQQINQVQSEKNDIIQSNNIQIGQLKQDLHDQSLQYKYKMGELEIQLQNIQCKDSDKKNKKIQDLERREIELVEANKQIKNEQIQLKIEYENQFKKIQLFNDQQKHQLEQLMQSSDQQKEDFQQKIQTYKIKVRSAEQRIGCSLREILSNIKTEHIALQTEVRRNLEIMKQQIKEIFIKILKKVTSIEQENQQNKANKKIELDTLIKEQKAKIKILTRANEKLRSQSMDEIQQLSLIVETMQKKMRESMSNAESKVIQVQQMYQQDLNNLQDICQINAEEQYQNKINNIEAKFFKQEELLQKKIQALEIEYSKTERDNVYLQNLIENKLKKLSKRVQQQEVEELDSKLKEKSSYSEYQQKNEDLRLINTKRISRQHIADELDNLKNNLQQRKEQMNATGNQTLRYLKELNKSISNINITNQRKENSQFIEQDNLDNQSNSFGQSQFYLDKGDITKRDSHPYLQNQQRSCSTIKTRVKNYNDLNSRSFYLPVNVGEEKINKLL